MEQDTIHLLNGQKKHLWKDGFFRTESDNGKTEYGFEFYRMKIVKIEIYNEALINQLLE